MKDINNKQIKLPADNVLSPSLGKSIEQAIRDRSIPIPLEDEEKIQELQEQIQQVVDTETIIEKVVVTVDEGNPDEAASATVTFLKGVLTLAFVNVKGATGEALTFDDLTDEQKAELKGEKGDPLTFDDLTDEQKAELKGEPGAPGAPGAPGKDGAITNLAQSVSASDTTHATSGKAVADYVAAHGGGGSVSIDTTIPASPSDSKVPSTKMLIDNFARKGSGGGVVPSADEIPYEDTNVGAKLTELEFENDSLKNRCYKLEEENPFKWSTLDKTKAIIVIDDCNENLPKIYDLTHAMNIPLSVACISSRLNTTYKTAYDYTTNKETTLTTARKVKDILTLVVADGGEVHCHGTSTTPLDENSTYEDYRNVFVNAKRAIESEGFKVRGIMRIGGNYFDVDGSENMQKWASAYYDYSDRYGNKEPFFHPRLNVASSTTNDGFIARMNTEIAKGNDSKIIVFMMHGSGSNTSLEYVVNFRSLLEQIKTTYGNTLEFTTLANVYDNFKSTYFAEEIKNLKNN